MKIFEHKGYHLDIYCTHTKKYLGSIPLPETVNKNITQRQKGYQGRKEEIIVATGVRGTKYIKFKGKYITELIPICGRIKNNAKEIIA